MLFEKSTSPNPSAKTFNRKRRTKHSANSTKNMQVLYLYIQYEVF